MQCVSPKYTPETVIVAPKYATLESPAFQNSNIVRFGFSGEEWILIGS
jgi:hypothetical protein